MRWRPFLLLCTCACGDGPAPLPEPTYVSSRTTEEVCTAWTTGHEEAPAPPWTADADECAPGTLTSDARDETLARIDLYRYLVELPTVTEDLAQRDDDQACAVMMHVNDKLDHSPPTSWDCYSEAGKRGAGTSNLAIGTGSPADAIDLFMRDSGVDSLGHRRWVINFDLGKVGIGFAGNATCLGVFDGSAPVTREWVAYPPPGPAPIETASEVWSFHATYALSGTDVTVHQLAGGAETRDRERPVHVHPLDSGYGAEAIGIYPEGWEPIAGERYRVGVTTPGHDAIVYDVAVVTCGG